jgi:phenylacetate-CoA ligase
MASWLTRARWNVFVLWHARHERRLPYWPLEDVLAVQSRRVRALVRHAYESVPYYREVMDGAGLRPDDFQTADDLSRLPILTGDQLAREPERFRSRRVAVAGCVQLGSSGTTGRAKSVHHDPAALFLSLAHGQRQRAVLAQFVGRSVGYREMNVTRPGSAYLRTRHFYEANSWVPRWIDLERSTLLPEDSFEENVAQINAFEPDVIFGYGSYIGAVFRYAWETGRSLALPKVVWYTSEHMPVPNRRLIETAFGVPVLASYGAVEAPRIAFQCERREGYHIGLDHVAVRVVDEDGEALPPGETGEVVISNLVNRATVLLNYRLGDRASLSRSLCPCGRTLPTIERIEGRSDSLIARPGGQLIHGAAVLAGLQAADGVVQVQLIQEDLLRFRVYAVCSGEADWERARLDMDTSMRALLAEDLSLAIERVDAIAPMPSGKIRPLISHCDT